ncbi:MAG: hypothetical protein M0R77_00180 [Gammaproteobacteria bacterium]|nr:hypothetical protein [Gammaproteobacteria bacterium]
MKVLPNHFNFNPTIIIHGRIINGCQDFTLEEAPAILKKYNVSDSVWQEVLDVYSPTSTDEEITSFINVGDWEVCSVIAKHGSDIHRDILVNNRGVFVRVAVAQYGNDDHRDILVNDTRAKVREVIAKYGNDSHRDILITDEDKHVRVMVVRYGNDNHRRILINDTDPYVSGIAAIYINYEYINNLKEK